MTCPLCRQPEGRERCNWPAPTSPPSFSAEQFFDDEIDLDTRAERLGASEFDRHEASRVMGINEKSIWHYVKCGVLDEPCRYLLPEETGVGRRAVWSARQVAKAIRRLERRKGRRVGA